MSKICRVCKTNKDLRDFPKSHCHKSGLDTQCIACKSIQSKEYTAKHKDRRNAYHRQYYQDNKPTFSEAQKKKRAENPEEFKAYYRKYYQDNKQEIHRKIREKRKKNVPFRLAHNGRTRLNKILKDGNANKVASARELCGCTPEDLKRHLESQFKLGMTWENHGVWRHGQPMTWHIDHIKPCASFDLTDPEQQKACFHYTNLQPLWALDNMSKQDTIPFST